MHFKTILFSLFLAFASVSAEERLLLSHNFTSKQNVDDIFSDKQNLFSRIKFALSKEGIDLSTSSLDHYNTWGNFFSFSPIKLEGDDKGVIFFNIPSYIKPHFYTRLDRSVAILFVWEPPTVMPNLYEPDLKNSFFRIYTWDDSLVDGINYFKFYYPVLSPMIKDLVPFKERRLCTMVVSNKTSGHPLELYSEREKAILFFLANHNDDFTFYGTGWKSKGYSNWGGEVDSKIDTLKNFRFSICYENMRDVEGYVTEKIFDCFAAGTIPIYWGASNITDYIPKECFIDRRQFKNNQALYDFIKNMNEPEFNRTIAAIRKFLDSEPAKKFSEKNFINTFIDATHSFKP